MTCMWVVRPEGFEPPANCLYYMNKYFIYPLHITCTDM
jgi:hypothetical protein